MFFLPPVAPARGQVACPECGAHNWDDFCFCFKCGWRRPVAVLPKSRLDIDWASVRHMHADVASAAASLASAGVKCRVFADFASFCASVPAEVNNGVGAVDVARASPRLVCLWLAFRATSSRTAKIIHVHDCPNANGGFAAPESQVPCDCPRRLKYTALEQLKKNLQSSFGEQLGLYGVYSDATGSGNPVNHYTVTDWIQQYAARQRALGVTVTQAVPLGREEA